MTGAPGGRASWNRQSDDYSPSFRAEIDRIVVEVGG